MTSTHRRLRAATLALAFVLSPATALAARVPVAYQLTLPTGQRATVYANGIAQVFSKDGRTIATRLLRPVPGYDGSGPHGGLPDKKAAMTQLLASHPRHPFAPGRVIVVYRDGVTATSDVVTVAASALRTHAPTTALAPAYTNSLAVNHVLASLGVDRSERLFRGFNRGVLAGLHLVDAYRLHVSGAAVPTAVAALLKLPAVAYAEPDWNVATMNAPAIAVRPNALQASRERDRSMAASAVQVGAQRSALPTNYALTSSAQSLLNAPGTGAAAAYDEIGTRLHQLPGQGEAITNVSLGDLDDAAAASNPNDPCYLYAAYYGPTTIVQGGQRYLDMPSMPLIPTYTADASGDLNADGEVCGVDPSISEIGLDFSMMAPLPHDLQRAGEQGSGFTDLLGIAPGAKYRLIVPASAAPADSDIDAAFLAAALQTPRPDVITASIGIGLDQYGFPSRYLEEDPLSEALIAAIVQQYHIVVCISGGDGTRTYTNVAIGPSGGSAPTNVVPNGGMPTSLNDDYLSTIPGLVFDSGSIDVGGTTLDDIFAAPPQYASKPNVVAQHAYAETRWTGFTNFSTGFGTRVDVAAPSDNVLSLAHDGPTADSVAVSLEGGTSASAPETAAAAAVLLQVARLTGHPLANPSAVRKLLKQTGSDVPAVTQSDVPSQIGPQIDLRAAVEKLLEKSGTTPAPGVARVAVEQRRDYSLLDAAFLSDTDPGNISLGSDPTTGLPDQLSWITIAPDWEFLPKGATYRLFVKGHPRKPIVQTPWARLLPATLFAAAGLPLPATSRKTLHLMYQALSGAKIVAAVDIPLTFGPAPTPLFAALAPQVPAVATGATIPVKYDLTGVVTGAPQLVVSEPGRVNPQTGQIFHPAYTVPLRSTKGTVKIPVTSLQGGGIYGIAVELNSTSQTYSDFAYTRISTPVTSEPPVTSGASEAPVILSGASEASAVEGRSAVEGPTIPGRPAAPLLASAGSTPGHVLDIPYGASFKVQFNVATVPGATGAMLEISAPAPGTYSILNPFNNPNGSEKDDNGVDTGSVYYKPLAGTKGSVTLKGVPAGLSPALEQTVRVLATRSGQVIGEAGDVSTIAMDGVVPADGGDVIGGWGIDPNGNDAFLTSRGTTASGQFFSSLETFHQKTNQIVSDVASAAPGNGYLTYGWPVYGGHLGLFASQNQASGATTYGLLDTIASGTLGSAWRPPFPSTFYIEGAAANAATHAGAFLGYDQTSSSYDVFTSDLLANTFSPLYNVSSQFSSTDNPSFNAIAENTTTDTAVLPVYRASAPITQMVLVDLASGAVTSFGGVGTGFVQSAAVDPVTDKAAVTTADGGLTIYDLAAKTGAEVFPPGFGGQYIAADPVHGLFVVEQVAAPTFQIDNNTLSRVLVYDENGNLVKTVGGLNLWYDLVSLGFNGLQIDPKTRTGYTTAPDYEELAPFNY